MDIIDEGSAAIQSLNTAWYQGRAEAVDMLRLDLLHPVISGNKWYKLKNNLHYALPKGYKAVLTFGGAYSNHLVAAAAAAKAFGIKAIGMVRGFHAGGRLTATLKECADNGMQLEFISREDYSRKDDLAFLEYLSGKFHEPFIIPEGGANDLGREGAEEIARMIPAAYTHVCVSVGTGTTLLGLRNALPDHQAVLGFVPMKGGQYLEQTISAFLKPGKNHKWQLFDEWHFGGFGRWNDELIAFMNAFYRQNNIPLDVVYTSKMMYGVRDLLEKDFFDKAARILCIHTGGLQGNVSVREELVW